MREAAIAVSTRIEKEGVKALVDEDGSVVIKMDGKVQKVLPPAEHRKVGKDSKKEKLKIFNLKDHHTAAQINLLMNQSQKPRDFGYYASVLKPDLAARDPQLYKKVMKPKIILKKAPFGIHQKTNANGQSLIFREIDADVSIFDDDAFHFYIIKYGEILGLNSLLLVNSSDRTISYDQKVKTIQFILSTESDLGVVESSWKHCLLFLHHNGTISKRQLLAQFTTPKRLAQQRQEKEMADTFDSIKQQSNGGDKRASTNRQ